MSRSFEVRLSGSGGQGLILAGIILARAAVIDKKKVTQTQSYGPESRGGYSRADVIVSNEEIYFPEATNFDCLLALTQEACDVYLYDLKEDGVLIIDTTFVKNLALAAENTYEIPFTEICTKELGSPISTNIMSLAFLVKLTKVVDEESLKISIAETVKPAFVDINHKAMQIGFDLATRTNQNNRTKIKILLRGWIYSTLCLIGEIMVKHISHIGIAVKDLEAGIAFYQKLGLKLEAIEEVPSQKVKVPSSPAEIPGSSSWLPPQRIALLPSLSRKRVKASNTWPSLLTIFLKALNKPKPKASCSLIKNPARVHMGQKLPFCIPNPLSGC